MVGAHGQPLRKPYSIACAPEEAAREGALELLVQVSGKSGAGPHFPSLHPGALIDVEGPFGRFVFSEQPAERRFLFIAGGSGIAPLRAMLHHALRVRGRDHFGVLYSARTPEEFAYQAELRRLARQGCVELTQTVTRSSDSTWTGQRGRINVQKLSPMLEGGAALCFVCGPRSMMEDVLSLLRELGVASRRIRVAEW